MDATVRGTIFFDALSGHKIQELTPKIMIVKSFWYGGALSPIEWLCLQSFVDRGISFHLYVYDESLEVPTGVVLKDARAFYPEDRVFFYRDGEKRGSVSAFSNVFRYKLLLETGGWWVDMDVLYTGHAVPETDQFFGEQRPNGKINCAIIRFEKGSEIMHRCLEAAERRGTDVSWGETGPNLLTQVLREEERATRAFPAEYSYPVSWTEALWTYLPAKRAEIEKRVETANAPFLHLWNEVLSRAGLQKDIAPPAGSYLGCYANAPDPPWPVLEPRYRPTSLEKLAHQYALSQELNVVKAELNSITEGRVWRAVTTARRLLSMD
jgi:hypothetical protein